jgi:hypothetical protein
MDGYTLSLCLCLDTDWNGLVWGFGHLVALAKNVGICKVNGQPNTAWPAVKARPAPSSQGLPFSFLYPSSQKKPLATWCRLVDFVTEKFLGGMAAVSAEGKAV